MLHKSVLLSESINNLNIKNGGVYVDATLGFGGHSSEILKKNKKGRLICFDQDNEAINYSKEYLSKFGDNFTIIKSNFVNMKSELNKLGITKVDGILFDLGVSSVQLDEAERGFSFHKDAKLDMRMNQDQDLSAYEVVNTYSFKDLVRILTKYGEEKYASSIARNIIKYREKKNIETTMELSEIVNSSVPMKVRREKNPSRKTFQAIRIEVNNELEVLSSALEQAIDLLDINGRICVITFHSLEDRIVKQTFKKYSEVDKMFKNLPEIPEEYKPILKLIGKSITPGNNELEENNRSRSSRLRVAEKIRIK
ncbi:MAG: 16S rRNA (cytosine(1402)-N(4))-methyltransferase RsmH [Bacilli bacterium]|nr:16S rRNA (cytosine(1402)-N(4))-methyltransferase RsmH [Bacilli bacterium]